jgi:hypothetical protein
MSDEQVVSVTALMVPTLGRQRDAFRVRETMRRYLERRARQAGLEIIGRPVLFTHTRASDLKVELRLEAVCQWKVEDERWDF